MKVLVTGANGYIGRHVIKVLLDRHVEVIACDITTTEVDKRAERMSLNLFRNTGRMLTYGLAQWICA